MVTREGSLISEGGTVRRTQVVTSSMLLDQINQGSLGATPSPDAARDNGPARDPSEPWLDDDHVADTQRFIDHVDDTVADFIV